MPSPHSEQAGRGEVALPDLPLKSFYHGLECSVSTPIKGSFLLDLESLLHTPRPWRMEPLRVILSSPRGARGAPCAGAPGTSQILS